MKILHWNCQGLRNPLTIQYLKEIRKTHSPDIMFLIETMNSNSYVHNIGEELGYANIFTLPPQGLSGGLAFFWNKDIQLSFDNPSVNYTDIYIAEGSIIFCLTYIYGHPDRRQRNGLWLEMKNMVKAGLYSHRPRLVMGDFNDIKSNDEKLGGSQRTEASFALFKEMLIVAGLHEVKTIGGQYTWAGQRYQHSIKTRIDRVFATSDWQDLFPKAYVQMLKWIGSDHRPLLLSTEDRKWKGMKLFRYDNRWRMDPAVYKVVDQAWISECAHLSPYNFSKALIKCRNALSRWKSSINTNSQKKIQQLQQQLHKALEEEYWKAKSRVQWLQAGDKNTKFFHAKTKQRRNFNRILFIQDDEGHVHQKPEAVQRVIEAYFQNIFTSNQSLISPEVLQGIPSTITNDINQDLTKPVTEQEVYKAVFSINPDKSPGADGLNAGFYRQHWNTIKQGVFHYVKLFFDHGYLEPELNHTHICLIPKIENPLTMKDYRPISLCNVAYKIISKILAERLKVWLNVIISENQSAFISGRLITDNVLIAHELLHSLHTKKRSDSYMALKLDISKAFDKVEWSFIDAVMERIGFNFKWRNWVMKCLTTVTYSVLINGAPSAKIVPQRCWSQTNVPHRKFRQKVSNI